MATIPSMGAAQLLLQWWYGPMMVHMIKITTDKYCICQQAYIYIYIYIYIYYIYN